MRRIFWLAMGITVGIMVMRRLQSAANQLKPNALAERTGRGVADVGHQAKAFWADVRVAMRQREAELMEGTGLDGDLGARPEDFDPRTPQ